MRQYLRQIFGDFPTKLTGGFLAVVFLLGGTALLTVRHLARTASGREASTQEHAQDLVLAERLRGDEKNVVAIGRGYLITGTPEFLVRLTAAQSRLGEVLERLERRALSPEGKALLGPIRAALGEYEAAVRRLVTARQQSTKPDDVIGQFEHEMVPRRQQLERAVALFVAHKRELLERGNAEARAGAWQASMVATLAVVAAIALSSLLAWILTRQLVWAYRREREVVDVARRAVAAREEVLGIVAHDLRGPLGAISLKAANLRKMAGDDKTRKSGEVIEKIARGMHHVVRSLLDAARADAGMFSVDPAPCAVSEILHEAVESFGIVASTRSINLELRAPDANIGVLADRDRLLQVLTNLIGNALKFTPVDGTVEVAAERAGEVVRFSVADTGPGIAPEHVPHLFERFWRAEKGIKTGSGLGLYIAREIVVAHGGNIWVETSRGRGATFYFTLSYSAPPRVQERPHLVRPTAGA